MMIIFLVTATIVNLVGLFFVIIQVSNIIKALEDILSEKDSKNSIHSVDHEDDLSLRLKDFQKMKFSGIGKK